MIATNSPITDRVVIPMKSYAYRTYVLGAIIPKESVPEALYRDNLHPYHYVRVWSGEHDDFLIIGGEDHKTGQHTKDDDERFERLEVRARERFPQIKRIVSRRSGQVMEPADYLAFIGPEPEGRKNVYIATGDSGNGLTHGTVA